MQDSDGVFVNGILFTGIGRVAGVLRGTGHGGVFHGRGDHGRLAERGIVGSS